MVDNVKDAPLRTLFYLLGVDASGKGGKQLASDFAGGGGGAGTVTSVGVSVPTGFSASGSPVTTSGTIAITYAAGYQGYTSAEATKLGHLTVTGAINLDNVKTKTDYLIVTGATNLDTIRNKVGYLTVTAPTDLDAIRTRINALDAAIILMGTFDPSAGVLPGSGTAQAGESWIAAGTGTIGGVAVTQGDRVIAITDNASTSVFTGNWFLADYTDKVQSVNGQVGGVLIEVIIQAATAKTALVDADLLGVVDSAPSNVLKRITWANVKATLKTYFDTIYQAADAAIAKLNVAQLWTKPQRTGITPLTSASTITIDGNAMGGNLLSLTLEHFATMANPVNLGEGTTFCIFGQQNADGGFTLSYASNWNPIGGPTAPAVPSAPNAKFRINGQVGPAGRIDFSVDSVGV